MSMITGGDEGIDAEDEEGNHEGNHWVVIATPQTSINDSHS